MAKPKIKFVDGGKVIKAQAPKPNADRPALGTTPIYEPPDSHGYHGKTASSRPHPSGGPIPGPLPKPAWKAAGERVMAKNMYREPPPKSPKPALKPGPVGGPNHPHHSPNPNPGHGSIPKGGAVQPKGNPNLPTQGR